MSIGKILDKWFMNRWFGGTVILSFLAMISYFQINSSRADKHHLNGFWTAAGIILTIAAIASCVKAVKTTNN